MDEKWNPVPSYEGLYDASDLGRIRSLDRTVVTRAGPRRYRGKILAAYVSPGGYPEVKLSDPVRGAVTRPVHLLVLAAFAGPPPPGMEACHGPAGKLDASLANLCYGTRSKNTGEDRLRDGQDNRGERHGMAVTTREVVLAVRARAAEGEHYRTLAEEYGLTWTNSWAIIHRKSWNWL